MSPIEPARLARISHSWLKGGAGGTLLAARLDGRPLAAALVIKYGATAYLDMLASSPQHNEVPASHLLVWEAIRWAKREGCTSFDFSGYSLVARPGDSLWGVNEFKRGFAGTDAIKISVAVHESVRSPLIVASARAVRVAQTRLRQREVLNWARATRHSRGSLTGTRSAG